MQTYGPTDIPSPDLQNGDSTVLFRNDRLYNKEPWENLVSIWETLPLFQTIHKSFPDEVWKCISKVKQYNLKTEEYFHNLGLAKNFFNRSQKLLTIKKIKWQGSSSNLLKTDIPSRIFLPSNYILNPECLLNYARWNHQ